jgi:hypothetical protein
MPAGAPAGHHVVSLLFPVSQVTAIGVGCWQGFVEAEAPLSPTLESGNEACLALATLGIHQFTTGFFNRKDIRSHLSATSYCG